MSRWIWAGVGVVALYSIFTGDDAHNRKPANPYFPQPATTLPEQQTPPILKTFPQTTSSSGDLSDLDDGEFECTATNLTRGNGPYSLTCEKDGEEIVINFSNGGHITTDIEGFHAETGDQWDIEAD